MNRWPLDSVWPRAAAGLIVAALSGAAMAAPSTQPALQQLSEESRNLYQQVQKQVVRVQTPVPDWMVTWLERENPLNKYPMLDAGVRQQLDRQKDKVLPLHRLHAELTPATHPATKSSPDVTVMPGSETNQGLVISIRSADQRAPTTQITITSVNTIGLVLDKSGHVLVPLYLEQQAAQRGPIEIFTADGKSSLARFIGSDQKTNLTIVQMERPLGEPAQLVQNRPEIGSLVMILTPNRASAQLSIWTGANHEFGIVAEMNGGIAGIVLGGQLLTPSTFTPITEQLIATGRVKRAILGVWINDIHPDDPLRQSIPALGNRPAIVVEKVTPGSAADKAGIQKGDLILRFAGEPIVDLYTFAAAMADHVGPTDLEVLRDGQIIKKSVMLVAK